jgi:hypothetical protein
VYGNENSIDSLAVARHGPHEPIEVRRTTGADRATRHVVRELRRTTDADARADAGPAKARRAVVLGVLPEPRTLASCGIASGPVIIRFGADGSGDAPFPCERTRNSAPNGNPQFISPSREVRGVA